LSRTQLVALGKWAKENAPDVIVPWVACEHPQLGAVECGGIDGRYGISNPPRHEIEGVCRRRARCSSASPHCCRGSSSRT
jgi:hypothetical protein